MVIQYPTGQIILYYGTGSCRLNGIKSSIEYPFQKIKYLIDELTKLIYKNKKSQ
jgi:hypothetical protein